TAVAVGGTGVGAPPAADVVAAELLVFAAVVLPLALLDAADDEDDVVLPAPPDTAVPAGVGFAAGALVAAAGAEVAVARLLLHAARIGKAANPADTAPARRMNCRRLHWAGETVGVVSCSRPCLRSLIDRSSR
ncbi:MAG: hypothetical protein ACTHMP_23360, partial [Thermomicrobiales bacterium]